VGECGLSRSGPVAGPARGLQGGGRLVCVLRVVPDKARCRTTHIRSSHSLRGEERVRMRPYRERNDERADGLPLGNIRLEDSPASGLSASPPSRLLLRPQAVVGRTRQLGDEGLRCRPREEDTHEWDNCPGGQVLRTVAWTTCHGHAVCLEWGREEMGFGGTRMNWRWPTVEYRTAIAMLGSRPRRFGPFLGRFVPQNKRALP
jgi:hypothetical protein